jgi:hypothetical protein
MDNGNMIINMEMVNNIGLMAHCFKENFIKDIKNMENLNGLMKHHILDNLDKVNYKEKEDSPIKMEDIIKASGKII